MKRIVILFGALLLLANNSLAQQKEPATKFFAGTGLGFPVPQLSYYGYSDSYNFGGGVTGGLSFRLLPRFRFRAAISYHRLRFDEQKFARVARIQNSGYSVDGGNEKLFGLMGGFKYSVRNSSYKNSPYILGGFGAHYLAERNIHFKENGSTEISEYRSKWAPTLRAGIGIDITRLEGLGFFTEASIVASFPEGSESSLYVPVTFGITL